MKIVFIDFALHGEPAVIHGEAVHCAQDQGKFWAYHDLLYENYSGAYSREQLDGFARSLSLDMAAFSQCLDSKKYRSFVMASTQEGRRQGIKIIPTILINNQRTIEGFLPFEELRPILEEELNKAP